MVRPPARGDWRQIGRRHAYSPSCCLTGIACQSGRTFPLRFLLLGRTTALQTPGSIFPTTVVHVAAHAG